MSTRRKIKKFRPNRGKGRRTKVKPKRNRPEVVAARTEIRDRKKADRLSRTCPPIPRGIQGVIEHSGNREMARGLEVREEVTYEALSIVRKNEESLPMSTIQGIYITVADQEKLREEAEVRVINSNLTGKGSINDPRTGVVERDLLCPTCCQGLTCPGHTSVIYLNQPMLHPLFIRWTIRVLVSTCNSCGNLIVPIEELIKEGILNYKSGARIRMIEAMSAGRHCLAAPPGMKACPKNPTFLAKESSEHSSIRAKVKTATREATITFPVERVQQILNMITQETASALGFDHGSHPKNFILRYLPVTPPQTRPASIQEGKVFVDMITSIYQTIVNANNNITVYTGSGDVEALDKAKTTLVNAVTDLVSKTDGAKLKGVGGRGNIPDIINGKRGVVRGAIEGKRVGQSGRAVITPGPDLRLWQVGVPEEMAKTFTVPATVTPANKHWLETLIRNGKANSIIPYKGKKSGVIISVTPNVLDTHSLKYGDTVLRQLQDGERADDIILNRNPSLNRGSIMGHEVKIIPGLTLSLFLSATTPYNADYDGDEMNVHIPQTVAARAEVRTVMNIRRWRGLGVIFDALTAATLLTLDDVYVEPDVYADCVMQMDHIGSRGKAITPLVDDGPDMSLFDRKIDAMRELGVPKHSGRGLFSLLLPRGFTYKREHGGNMVNIVNGVLIRGTITKADIGPGSGKIIRKLWDLYGGDTPIIFVSDATRMLQRWITHRGFSMGLDDCYPFNQADNDRLKAEVQSEISKAKLSLQALGDPLEDPIEEARRERDIVASLDITKVVGQKITREVLIRKPLEVVGKETRQVKVITLTADGSGGVTRTEAPGKMLEISDALLTSKEFDYYVRLGAEIIVGIEDSIYLAKSMEPTPSIPNHAGVFVETEGRVFFQLLGVISPAEDRITRQVLVRKPYEDSDRRGEPVIFVSTSEGYGKPKVKSETIGYLIEVETSLLTGSEISGYNRQDIRAVMKIDNHFLTSKDLIRVKSMANKEAFYVQKKDGSIHELLGVEMSTSASVRENGLVIMSKSGAKGDPVNIAQITSLLGQQFLSGERMPIGIQGQRSSPYFEPGCLDPRSRGFCVNSYLRGLDPSEFFFSAVAGREGLADTAIGTQDTGTFQRNAVKGMEGIILHKDGSVRSSTGRIIQFTYGVDGMDPEKTKRVKIRGKTVSSFVNVSQLADKINSEHGYTGTI